MALEKLVVFDTTGHKLHTLIKVVFETESTVNVFVNNANPRPITLSYISPVLISGENHKIMDTAIMPFI